MADSGNGLWVSALAAGHMATLLYVHSYFCRGTPLHQHRTRNPELFSVDLYRKARSVATTSHNFCLLFGNSSIHCRANFLKFLSNWSTWVSLKGSIALNFEEVGQSAKLLSPDVRILRVPNRSQVWLNQRRFEISRIWFCSGLLWSLRPGNVVRKCVSRVYVQWEKRQKAFLCKSQSQTGAE